MLFQYNAYNIYFYILFRFCFLILLYIYFSSDISHLPRCEQFPVSWKLLIAKIIVFAGKPCDSFSLSLFIFKLRIIENDDFLNNRIYLKHLAHKENLRTPEKFFLRLNYYLLTSVQYRQNRFLAEADITQLKGYKIYLYVMT